MSFSWVSPNFGSLDLIEVYIEFNGPKLFSCCNNLGQIFLALWFDEEEYKEIWFYILVSLEKLKNIREGRVDLHEAFLKSENSFIYQVEIDVEKELEFVEKIDSLHINKEWLPLPDTFIRCEEENFKINLLSQNASLVQDAVQKRREIVSLRLESQSKYDNEISIHYLSNILNSFQSLINAISKEINQNHFLEKNTQFNLFATSPGSFKLELGSVVNDISDNSLVGDSIEEFLKLIKASRNNESLQELISQRSQKIFDGYRGFIQSLAKSNCRIDIDWASPTPNRGSIKQASLSNARDIVNSLKETKLPEERKISVMGELFKIDIDKWKFGIKDMTSSKNYEGKILNSARRPASVATMNKVYEAEIKVITKLTVTNEIKHYYELISLKEFIPKYKEISQ